MLSLSDIIRITQEYGFQTLGGILVMGVIYLMAKGHVDIWTFKKKRELGDNKVTKKEFEDLKTELLASDFFRNMRFKIAVDIPSGNFSDDAVLDLIYKDMLICLFRNYDIVLRNQIAALQCSDSVDVWVNCFMETIYHTMDAFEKDARSMGIPEPAILEFAAWFSPFLHQIYNYITIIDVSEPRCMLRKTKFFLLTLELILVNATAQAEKLQVFEGKFDGHSYNGKSIGSHNSTQ